MSIIGDIVGSISKAVLPSVIDSPLTDNGSLAHESLLVQVSSASDATGASIPHVDLPPAIAALTPDAGHASTCSLYGDAVR